MTTIASAISTSSISRPGVLSRSAIVSGLSPAAARSVVALAMAAGLIAGFLLTGQQDVARAMHQAGPELVRLLRGMAIIKMLMAALVSSVLLWRLAGPAPRFWLAAYAVAGAAMATGPGLIWCMAHVAVGAALLHGGMLATVLLLWRDPATGQRLAAAVSRRRARGQAVSSPL